MPDRRTALELIDAEAVGRPMLEQLDQAYRVGARFSRAAPTIPAGGRTPPRRSAKRRSRLIERRDARLLLRVAPIRAPISKPLRRYDAAGIAIGSVAQRY
jgi:hypothetical protein